MSERLAIYRERHHVSLLRASIVIGSLLLAVVLSALIALASSPH